VKKINKIYLGWLAFAFVVTHFTMIFIYAFPTEYIPERLKNVASVYVYPVFEQSWSLFAPCPIIDSHLRVKYYFDSDSTGWINPIAHAEAVHSKLRFTHHGELVLGESNLLFWVAGDLNGMGIPLHEPFPVDSSGSFKNTSSYWMMSRYLYGNADYLFGRRPEAAYAECTFQNVVTGDSGVMVLPEFNWKK